MAMFCNSECEQVGSICDFCAHYDFNGNGSDGGGAYIGNGYCNALQIKKEPEHGCSCNIFICFRTQQGAKIRLLRRINKKIVLSRKQ